MNDPVLAIKKLEDLLHIAKSADTEAERAAIYAATQCLSADLKEHFETFDPYLIENIERARWSICAMVGYDITNDHDISQHASWASSAIDILRRNIIK
jgi:oligoendopeptidase F